MTTNSMLFMNLKLILFKFILFSLLCKFHPKDSTMPLRWIYAVEFMDVVILKLLSYQSSHNGLTEARVFSEYI